MREVWRDIADSVGHEPSGNRQQTGELYSWFACPLLDLQADSRTLVRNGGALSRQIST